MKKRFPLTNIFFTLLFYSVAGCATSNATTTSNATAISNATANKKTPHELNAISTTQDSTSPITKIENSEYTIVNTETKDFLPTEQNVKFLGRTVIKNNLLIMSYSSTGAAFSIKAKRLDITIRGDTAANMTQDNGSAARIAVFLNGERKLDKMILEQSQTFTIFDTIEEIEGEVEIIKISETANSLAGIEKITTDRDGSIWPASQKQLKIEFIGDSITCGYGVDDENLNHHFKTSTEDNTKSFAYRTAKALDADYSMVCISGWGIISGYSGDGKKHPESQLPAYYDKVGFTWGNTIDGFNPKNTEWDFDRFVPDIIVINLGTNDSSYTKGVKSKINEYKSAYVDFIHQVRKRNPDAQIICSLGILGQDLYSALSDAVREYVAETGDEKVVAFKFDSQNMSDGIAADWHPSSKTHAKAAKKLTDFITKLGY